MYGSIGFQSSRAIQEEQQHGEEAEEHVEVALEVIETVAGAVPTGELRHLEVPGHHYRVQHIREGDEQRDVAEAALRRKGRIHLARRLIIDEQAIQPPKE